MNMLFKIDIAILTNADKGNLKEKARCLNTSFYKIKKMLAKVGLELKTPGLQDQCSNH